MFTVVDIVLPKNEIREEIKYLLLSFGSTDQDMTQVVNFLNAENAQIDRDILHGVYGESQFRTIIKGKRKFIGLGGNEESFIRISSKKKNYVVIHKFMPFFVDEDNLAKIKKDIDNEQIVLLADAEKK